MNSEMQTGARLSAAWRCAATRETADSTHNRQRQQLILFIGKSLYRELYRNTARSTKFAVKFAIKFVQTRYPCGALSWARLTPSRSWRVASILGTYIWVSAGKRVLIWSKVLA